MSLASLYRVFNLSWFSRNPPNGPLFRITQGVTVSLLCYGVGVDIRRLVYLLSISVRLESFRDCDLLSLYLMNLCD